MPRNFVCPVLFICLRHGSGLPRSNCLKTSAKLENNFTLFQPNPSLSHTFMFSSNYPTFTTAMLNQPRPMRFSQIVRGTSSNTAPHPLMAPTLQVSATGTPTTSALPAAIAPGAVGAGVSQVANGSDNTTPVGCFTGILLLLKFKHGT
ncbi:hypothetical protein B0H10DRAFT_1983637 [Mycena sp. CBHHK59/15]|nr:hypothetical protein B0H10DRAFT_2022698 [Mycena sp. CBHHK59/15]KAJ6630211.1 hypothetical protein B0H10DRAFT_1983637 [Mycena sp. CBHHK59/15]